MQTIRNNVRGAWRLGALVAVIVWCAVEYACFREHRINATARAKWLQRTCRRALRALAVQVDSRGKPARGALIVSNHLSYLDILVLASLTPVVFVSKKEVRAWPVFGWFAEKAGTRFIDRTRRGDVARIADEVGPAIAEGLGVVLFLEGTTTDGQTVLPFKSSLLKPAVAGCWSVVPVALDYTVPEGRSAAQEVCWWGDMTLAPHLFNFTTVQWVKARVSWGEALSARGDRKDLAEALRSDVVKLRKDSVQSRRMGDNRGEERAFL
jgi:lyso-ornithine lipid O-acyltransferase